MEPAVLLVPAALALVGLLWFVGTYNGLIRLRNHCRESWSGIDTELKRRHDLIPPLVECVRGVANHEKQLFAEVAEARTRADSAAAGPANADLRRAENDLVGGVTRLIAVAEGFPKLTADDHFLRLQQELVNTEDRIQAARRFFNANVRDLNTRVEAFPSSIVAGFAGIGKADFFEIDRLEIRNPPRVAL